MKPTDTQVRAYQAMMRPILEAHQERQKTLPEWARSTPGWMITPTEHCAHGQPRRLCPACGGF